MIVVCKKNLLVVILLVLAVVASVGIGLAVTLSAASPIPEKIVVLDAGHGGVDKGATGVKTGIDESQINLAIVLKTANYLRKQGIGVVLTRTDENGLYGTPDGGFKLRDMRARRQIIMDAKPDIVVSVHCNKFPSAPDRRGAQVFFNGKSDPARTLATALQQSLNTLNNQNSVKAYTALKADYYILNCTPYPSALVECGFLSNPTDEHLLSTPEHQEQVAYFVFSGIMAHLAAPDAPV